MGFFTESETVKGPLGIRNVLEPGHARSRGLGGIKINEKMAVLEKNGHPIKGLYAVGCDAGGIYGDSYDLIVSGIGSSFAFNSGRIAGENAAGCIKASPS